MKNKDLFNGYDGYKASTREENEEILKLLEYCIEELKEELNCHIRLKENLEKHLERPQLKIVN